jgi:glycosyltransferase involved in cell wall biosynthesis
MTVMVKLGMKERDELKTYISEPKRLTILLLTWEFPPHIIGGLARHTEGLSLQLQKLGVDVHVITTKPNHMVSAYEEIDGVKVHRVEPLNAMDPQFLNWIGGLNLRIAEKALELAGENKFHLIHAHDWLVGEAAKTLSKELKLPLITTIHGTEYGRNAGIYTELQKFIHNKELQLIQSSQQLIVCSEFMKEEIKEVFNASEDKMSIIPNGVRIEKQKDDSNHHLHPILQKEKRKIIFSIGRLVQEKGFDLLIEAASKMNRKDICFVLAGNGPMYQEYERLIKRHKLEDVIYLIGFISDQQRNQFFERSTIAIFPSRYEPFGIVALEAMTFSKPIIVSETGGLRGINKHLKTGLFMEPDNVENLVEQIEWILSCPEVAQEMAANGKYLVEYYYSWQRVAEMTKRQYEELQLLFTINEELNRLYIK